jgi:hypothetical protein
MRRGRGGEGEGEGDGEREGGGWGWGSGVGGGGRERERERGSERMLQGKIEVLNREAHKSHAWWRAVTAAACVGGALEALWMEALRWAGWDEGGIYKEELIWTPPKRQNRELTPERPKLEYRCQEGRSGFRAFGFQVHSSGCFSKSTDS